MKYQVLSSQTIESVSVCKIFNDERSVAVDHRPCPNHRATSSNHCPECQHHANGECDGFEGHPTLNTIADARMGPRIPTEICITCGGTYWTCQGHYGMIELADPVFNVHYEPFIKTAMVCSQPYPVYRTNVLR
jgi:hypothetical protein